jgi:hypothetical protein
MALARLGQPFTSSDCFWRRKSLAAGDSASIAGSGLAVDGILRVTGTRDAFHQLAMNDSRPFVRLLGGHFLHLNPPKYVVNEK